MSHNNITDIQGDTCQGEVEIVIHDVNTGEIVGHETSKNTVKAFAKEILSHRVMHDKIWDPGANSGAGAWVNNGIDINGDYGVKYILLGASFNEFGAPLDTADTRFYTNDPISGGVTAIRLDGGLNNGGDLINPIPIAEPSRPLKRIERVYFEPTYQPAGVPLLQDDVRAMNSIVVFETVLRSDEYNGFGTSGSDFFTITEIGLAGGKELDAVLGCECSPSNLLLEGKTGDVAIKVTANGSSVVTIHPDDAAFVDVIKEGDQIKLVHEGAAKSDDSTIDMVSDYYLVINKSVGGSDITLDRNVIDSNGDAITGQIGAFRSTLRLYAHKILAAPLKKNASFEITIRWRIRFS